LVDEALLELGVVLDDPVHDDVDAIGGVVVRMGVLLAHPAMGRPARVTDPGRRDPRRHRDATVVRTVDGGTQRAQVADRADGLDLVTGDDRDAGAVIAPVLELLQAGEDEVLNRAPPDVPHDSAHGRRPFS
jgi:hypothetical protein